MLRKLASAAVALTIGASGAYAQDPMSADEIRARIIKQREELSAAQTGGDEATRGLKRAGAPKTASTGGATVSGSTTQTARSEPRQEITDQSTASTPAGYTPGLTDDATIDLEIRFAFGSTRLDPRARAQLSEMCRALRDDAGTEPFVIIGHTDSVGSDDYNLTLSQERAKEVVRYLSGAECGMKSNRLRAMGMGERKLKNAADPRAAENRRVEIQIGV